MSTITKIFKTAGAAAFCNVISAFVVRDSENEILPAVIDNIIFVTLPALVGVGMDRVVNQKFTSNKPIQYALTSVESTLTAFTLFYLISSSDQKSFKELCSENAKNLTLLAANTMCQSLSFKYIWDSSDETHELNTEFDQQVEELNS
jgi:hypothetical protein